ncbi:putative ATPase [Neisseria sp. HSC-16F19]|nr:AAA family ATPase [Neisseria sp. HSC-16F19]MCP2040082.1 putative ATPase [Neisseria sp. HSC-16F19]
MNLKPRIKIKNFGAIKSTNPDNDGWLDIDKVTVFIGDQGSGKSTVAKLISTFMWIEKALVRGDYDEKFFHRKGKFVNQLKYHRLEHYPHANSYIEYEGLEKHIVYEDGRLRIEDTIKSNPEAYVLPQIMYIPAERNFISYVKSARELKISSESMQEFLTEFNNAKKLIKQTFNLPIGGVSLEYDRLNDRLNLKGQEYKIQLSDGSSGFQSTVPLLLVSDYLAKSVQNPKGNNVPMSEKERENFANEMKQILGNADLSEEQRRMAISLVSARFNKKSFINIVEEPEQNLFPGSQWEILKELLKLNTFNKNNQLIMTTHSPYIVNYLSIAVAAKQAFENSLTPTVENLEKQIKEKINQIVPETAWLDSGDLSVYQLKDGKVTLLPEIDGIPSDDNDLNQMLIAGNELIDQLLEIEDEYRGR